VPSYVYECSECGEVLEVFHSMSDELSDCEICGRENSLNKIPEVPIYVKNKSAGNIVKQHIEDAKKQIRQEKEEMKKDYRS
tara:strand:- start:10007 stop:10249 length:243 start_codon:yes stop_codon:yes gene_type:complete